MKSILSLKVIIFGKLCPIILQNKILGNYYTTLHLVVFLPANLLRSARMLAASGRVYQFDPPLNPLLGGDLGYNSLCC